jgi:hypothetical protein
MRTPLSHAPQAGRIEPADDHAALRHQHALDLAQRAVRVVAEFQRMRQHHQVEAVGRKRQRGEVGDQCAPRGQVGIVHRQPAVRHAVGAQPLHLGQAELQCVITEDVRHRLVEA